MITEKEKAIAEEYLADKLIEGVWVNSEGELFFSKELAKASDKEAEFVKKKAVKKETESDNQDADALELKANNIKLLEETELKKENYQQMKALAKFFDLKTEDNKADTLIIALTEFKENLKHV